MFTKKSSEGYLPIINKITMKTLVHGNKTLMSEFQLQEGASLPRHSHPHEQTGYLIAGRMKMTIGDTCQIVEPGDSWSIAGDVEHSALVLEDSIAIEVFSPVREDYLPEPS